MELLVLGYLILLLTGSPFQVGLIAVFLSLPRPVFSLFAGLVADRLDRRRVLMGVHGTYLVISTVLLVLLVRDAIEPWHIFLAVLLQGSAKVLDDPSRRTAIFDLAGRNNLASAMSLLSRGETGRGQVVEVSETEVSAVLLNGYHLPTYIYKGVPGRRWGNRMSLGLFPNCVLPASDGHICIDTPQLEQYQRFLQLLGEQPWSENPRYRNRRAMTEEYPEESEALIAPWFRERTKADIFELCRQNRVPCVPVKTIDEVISEPHLRQRGYWQERQQPGIGELTYPGPPYRFPRSPWRLARPAPRLGQHNQEVYCGRLGFSPGELTRLHQAGVV